MEYYLYVQYIIIYGILSVCVEHIILDFERKSNRSMLCVPWIALNS